MESDVIKRQLEERLASMQKRLASLKADASQSHSGDSAEQAQERENDEVVDAIGKETELSILVLTAALERIEDGSYGACANCGEPIDEARLEAVPEAARCLACAD